MSVNELIFSQNKYVRVTNGSQVLIAIGPKTSIYVSDPHGETVEKHTPCLAWATSVNGNETFEGGNRPYYKINSFVGTVYKTINPYVPEEMNSRLGASTMLVDASNAIVVSGGNSLL